MATFSLTANDEKDWDCRAVYIDGEFDSWEKQDAGVDLTDIQWECDAGTGTAAPVGASWAAYFKPSGTVHHDINISVKLPDGPNYNPADPDVEREWGSTLTTFMVGVQLGYTQMVELFEDDEETSDTNTTTLQHLDCQFVLSR